MTRQTLVIAVGLMGVAALASGQDLPEFRLDAVYIAKVSVTFDRGHRTMLDIHIQHPTKALEFSQFTMDNLMKQVRIVIDDQVVQEPVIREPQVGSIISLGMKSVDEAVAVMKRLREKWDPNKPHAPDPHSSGR